MPSSTRAYSAASGMSETMAERCYRDITEGPLPLHALDETTAQLRRKLPGHALAPSYL